MTVYKYFLRTALRQRWIIIGYAIIFFVLSIINGSNAESKEIVFTEQSLNIGVVDNSNNELSNGLIDYLDKNNNIITMKEDRNNIKEQIFLEVVDSVIIIPEDFETKVENKEVAIEIFRDDRKMAAMQVQNEVNKYLMFSNATYEDNELNLVKVKNALDQQVEVELLKSGDVSKNEWASNWFKYYFNFTAYIIIAIYVAVIGLIMTEFNDKNIQDRMKISSKGFLKFNTEIYLGQVTIGILITSIFILGAFILKGKYIYEVDFLKYLINLYVFSFAILCFTFLINNITRSRFVINGVSTVASLGTAFISGVFVPQEFLGQKVLNVARFFPTYYFVRINDMRVEAFSDMRYEIFMQVLFGFAFLTIGLYFSKTKQKS